MAACSCPRQASLDPAAAQLPAEQASASIWTCLHQHKPAPVGLCRPDLAPEQLTGSYIIPTALLQVLGLFHSALQCQGVLVPDEHHPGRFEILFTEPRPGSRWGLLHLAASQFCSSPMVPACLSAVDKPIYIQPQGTACCRWAATAGGLMPPPACTAGMTDAKDPVATCCCRSAHRCGSLHTLRHPQHTCLTSRLRVLTVAAGLHTQLHERSHLPPLGVPPARLGTGQTPSLAPQRLWWSSLMMSEPGGQD